MKVRFLAFFFLTSFLFSCTKPAPEVDPQGNDDPQKDTTIVTPVPADDDLAPQVKDGDVILVTNARVEKFVTEVKYPERDYSETCILDTLNYGRTAPGNSDKPNQFTIRWEADEAGGTPVARLWEDDGWSRDYTSLKPTDYYITITNLRPNAKYHFEVKNESKVLTSGSFETTGHVHQLYFFSRVRNVRDLGGWPTKDGKTVKYRKIYRGGRLEAGTISGTGKTDLKAEGIKAQLDLRGHSDVLSSSPMGPEFIFFAPCIEEGYVQLLKDDQEKAKQCMEFIMQCVREDNPVYFHCSLGRDRTGTISMLILGLLGVDEGEISKEYELTQFAPHGWATSDGEKTKMTRRVDYKGAANYIWNNFVEDGETFADGVRNYLITIGISQADIDEFRSLMLE